MFGFKKKDKVSSKRLSMYPCDIYLHNALRFIREGDYDNAYDEICWAITKSGGKLNTDELIEKINREDTINK